MRFFTELSRAWSHLVSPRTVHGAWIDAVSAALDASGQVSQLEWWFDSVNGKNSNGGTSASDALQTPDALTRRVGSSPEWTAGAYHFYFLNDCPATAAGVIRFQGFRSSNASITVHGSATPGQGQSGLVNGNPFIPFTAAITSVNALDRVGPPQRSWQLVCAGIPVSWTASNLVGKRIRWTSGISALSWVEIDKTAKTAEIAQVLTTSTFSPQYQQHLTAQIPAGAQTFIVERLTQLPQVIVTLNVVDDYTTNTSLAGLVFDSVEVGKIFTQNLAINSTESIVFDGCIVQMNESVVAAGFIDCQNCQFSQCNWASAGVQGQIFGGFAPSTCTVSFASSDLVVEADFQVRGGDKVQILGGLTHLYRMAVFDTTGQCGVRYRGGKLQFHSGSVLEPAGPSRVWGSGNAGVGVGLGGGNVLLWDNTAFAANAISITGVSGDFSFDSFLTGFPFNVGTRVYDPAVPCTWTNAASGTLGGTPFKAIDPRSGAGLSNGGALS